MKLDAMTNIKELKAEISLLSKISCTNIVKYYGSYIKNRNLWVSPNFFSKMMSPTKITSDLNGILRCGFRFRHADSIKETIQRTADCNSHCSSFTGSHLSS